MKKNLLLAIKYFKRKKTQVVLLSTIIITTILMISSSIILLGSYESGAKLFEKLNAADSIIITNTSKENTNSFKEFASNNNNIKDVFSEECYVPNSTIVLNKNDSSILAILQPYNNLKYNKIEVLKGENKEKPTGNEVFLPTGYAKTYSINVGDIISFNENGKLIELEVTALILDAHFSSGALQPSSIYISDELFQTFKSNTTKISIKFDEYSKTTELDFITSIDEYTNNTPIGLYLDHESMVAAYGGFSVIMSIIMIIVGIILLLISLLVISNSIANAINEEYKNIGVLKAEGFTNKSIITIYTMRYLFISLLAIPFAFAISILINNMITASLQETYGNISDLVSGVGPILISSGLVTLIIFISSFIFSLKTKKVKPAEAIRYGRQIIKTRNTNFNISTSSLPIIQSIAIKEVLIEKRKSISMFITLMLSIVMIIICLIANNTFSDEKVIRELMGASDFDLQVSKQDSSENITTKEFISKIENIDNVKNAYTVTVLTNSSRYDKEINRTVFFIGSSYSSFEGANYPFIEGNGPRNKNEVAITYKIAEIYNLNIGDYFEFNLEGEKKEFQITGIYQTVSNMGMGFLIVDDALPSEDYISISFVKSTYIKLENGADKEEVKTLIKNELNENVKIENENAFIDMFSTVGNGVTSTINLMIIILLGLIFVIIFNTVMIQVRNSSKKIGIYKGFGYSINKTRLIFVYRNIFIAAIASIVSTAVGILITPSIINALLRNTIGIYKLSVSISFLNIIFINLLFILIVLLSSWISTSRIKKISPRILISE